MNEEILNNVNVNTDDNRNMPHIDPSDEQITIPPVKVAPLKKICMTIGALPTSYLETMTYYEMLVWFIEFLRNTVIPTINTNSEAVQEVQNIVMELQTYINNYKDAVDEEIDNFETAVNQDIEDLETYMNNYFDNLDVQEEINNKLDDMVEQGTLQEIIADYLNSKAVFGFDTVADMKDSTNLINGSYARTLGFHSKNDGGGALYKIRTVTNDDVVNEMDIIEMNDSSNQLIAELISDKSNIFCYGVTSDDSNEDNATIINYVITKEKNIYSKLDFTITDTIVFNNINKQFDFSNITYTGNAVAILINNHDIKINGNTITSSNNGIKLGNTNVVLNVVLNITRINAEYNGIVLGGSAGVQGTTLNISQINYKEHGLFFDLSNEYVGQISVYNTNFTDLSSGNDDNYAIYMDTTNKSCTGLEMFDCSFEGSKGGIYVKSTTYRFLEKLNIYGLRCAEMSLNNSRKIITLSTTQLNSNVKGVVYFDQADTDAFDLSDYKTYGQNCLVFNGAFMHRGSETVLATQAKANYGGIVLTEYTRGYSFANVQDQVYPYAYDNIYLSNSTGSEISINVMPKRNELYTKPFRIYVSGDSISKVKLVSGTGNTLKAEISVAQNDIIEVVPAAVFYAYGYEGYYIKYKKSDGTITWSRIAHTLS